MRLNRRLSALFVFVVLLLLPSHALAQKAAVFVDPVNIAQLRTECLTNPNGYSYTDPGSGTTQTLAQWYAAGADNIVAEILNTTRAGIAIYRSDVTPQEVTEATAVANFVPAGSQTLYGAAWYKNFGSLPVVRLLTKTGADSRVMTNLLLLLTNGTASENRLRALGSRSGSRAEQLWGCTTTNEPGCEYVTVQPFHVAQARSLP